MKKPPVIVLHSLFWAAIILLFAWVFRDAGQSGSWLFCAVALWCCSHSLLQYGVCRRKPCCNLVSDSNKDVK
ncbi:MAG: hypothetical protein CML20_23500 [Rheinheimera sp.]|uniref:hypothetical protein n=1 Tax=Arsukibacterium sp. UBA3155 TaxID=1946058 RepID=UPI000C93A3D8|nr:hypothetical protein [Arsukibacterium sp. UBA3155]MAD77693.1 hypothetical protein [Rheinheimera sp.]|tara:strand:+ start:58987 stop:59202 length:216 start_codon:yes stop_codon:yes gene_type:complete